MGELIDAAASVLSNSERKLERISNNIANIGTPGFKRNISVSHISVKTNRDDHVQNSQSFFIDSSAGILKQTDNPFDFSIVGNGNFMVRHGGKFFFTRSGQFSRGPDGALRDPNGMILQLAGGGDAVAEGEVIKILDDGMMLSDGMPIGAIGVFATPDDMDSSPAENLIPVVDAPMAIETGEFEIRQGMLEASNVVLSDEMVAMMANVRQAEGAAQLVRFYDQLVGQAITTFARAGR